MRRISILACVLCASVLAYAGGRPATNAVCRASTTNTVARANATPPANDERCEATTKSGNRCKRKAAPGKLYCRQHAAQSPSAKPSETCAYISDDGKRCTASAASGSRFCAKHQDK